MDYLKDKYLLLPFVSKSDFLYTKLKLTPNAITIFNAYFVTSVLFYYWYKNYYFYAGVLLFLRNILDGCDGYIARKYNLTSKEGEIYDHCSDSITIGLYFLTLLNKLSVPLVYSIPACNIIIMTSIVCNFTENYEFIGEYIVGSGGSYESYCTLLYFMGNYILWVI